MKRILYIVMLIIFCFFLASCGKDDYNDSKHIFAKYEEKLKQEGYVLNKIDANNNVSGWLGIEDKDVVEIYRSYSDSEQGVVYFYLFPKIKTAEKWHKKIKSLVENTNYSVYIDGHYVIICLGYDLTLTIENINNK